MASRAGVVTGFAASRAGCDPDPHSAISKLTAVVESA